MKELDMVFLFEIKMPLLAKGHAQGARLPSHLPEFLPDLAPFTRS
jgi:hypothetical protein